MTGDHFHEQRGISDRGGEGSDLVEAAAECDEALARHRAVGRLHSDETTKCSRLADASTRIAAERGSRKTGGDRSCTAAARTTWHTGGVERVACRAKRRVLGAGTHREFVEVRLADEHCAFVGQTSYDRGVVGRLPPGENLRRARRLHAARAHVVFQRNRDAGETSDLLSRLHIGVDLRCTFARTIGSHQVERVDFFLAGVDCSEVFFEHLRSRQCT